MQKYIKHSFNSSSYPNKTSISNHPNNPNKSFITSRYHFKLYIILSQILKVPYLFPNMRVIKLHNFREEYIINLKMSQSGSTAIPIDGNAGRGDRLNKTG